MDERHEVDPYSLLCSEAFNQAVETIVDDAIAERLDGDSPLEERRRLTCLQYAHSFYSDRADAKLSDVLAAATLFEEFLLGRSNSALNTKGTF